MRKLNGMPPWLGFLLSFAIAVAAVAAGWTRLEAAAEKTQENTERIQELETKYGSIDKAQGIIQKDVEDLGRRQGEFREDTKDNFEDTKEDLREIIRLLRPAIGPPR